MVLDATTTAFPEHAALDNKPAPTYPLPAAPKPSVAQSAPDVPNRPAKRRRISQVNARSSLAICSPGPSSVTSAAEFDELVDTARRRASARVMSLWESLAARYARPLDEDDEIDILTGKIYKDRGVLRAASDRGWRIGSFGEAIEVEPLFGASETETETGTSECDGTAEEEDTAGETEDADEGEDSFETLSYDWQFRELAPPRPELSPQDAEDLKEFLAAERNIQEENERRNGTKTETVEEEGEVVYLGDSRHDQDGALLGDDSDDEEFSSFMVDDPTMRVAKHEESEDEDDVEPVSSILGALALGKTPQKRPAISGHTESLLDKRVAKSLGSPSQSTRTRPENPGTPSACNIHSGASPPPSVRPGSKAEVDDELIVIDSDTDEEDHANMTLAPSSSSPTKDCISKLSVLSVKPASSVSISSSETTQQNRTSFSAMVASLQASVIADKPKLGVAAASMDPTTSLASKPSSKPISKRMHSRTVTKTENNKFSAAVGTRTTTSLPVSSDVSKTYAGAAKATTCVSSSYPTTSSPKDPTGTSPTKASIRPTSGVSRKATPKSTLGRANEPQNVSTMTTTEPRSATARAIDADRTTSKLTKGDTSVFATKPSGLSTAVVSEASKLTQPASPGSSSRSTRLKSPVKSSKKPLVMEVVLTPLRGNSKPISLASSRSPGPSATRSPIARSGPSSKSLVASEAKPTMSIPNASGEKDGQTSESAALAKIGAQVNHTRKRARESGEGPKTELNTVEPQKRIEAVPVEQPQTVEAYSCCPPMPSRPGQAQPSTCCSMPFGYFPPPPQPSNGCSHTHSQGACSHSHQAHHCSNVHQHQHQHLHTHLPFLLPQHMHSLTANELTEAALKIMYGLGAVQSSEAGGNGHQMWLPPAMHIPYASAAMGTMQAQPQAGPSAPASPPKLEPESSSQEVIPDSQEKIPSSQEYERRNEGKQKGKAKDQPVYTKPESPPLFHSNSRPPSPRPVIQRQTTPSRPKTPPDWRMDVSSTPSKDIPPQLSPKIPTPKRESSVIDIESDSDDELADFNAGEGSMRWEPPIKDEVDLDNAGLGLSESDDDIILIGRLGEGKSKRRLRSKKDREKQHTSRYASPSKARKMF
ncbi:hypothetical protein FRC09_015533 [Ceratobasidium sp. 395]|nr:hypothetical protein FRC09_015533 [Ceratobasidium sp. 395]